MVVILNLTGEVGGAQIVPNPQRVTSEPNLINLSPCIFRLSDLAGLRKQAKLGRPPACRRAGGAGRVTVPS